MEKTKRVQFYYRNSGVFAKDYIGYASSADIKAFNTNPASYFKAVILTDDDYYGYGLPDILSADDLAKLERGA